MVFATFIYIPNSQAAPLPSCAPTLTTYSNYNVLSFTSTGTCTWTAPTDISSGDILLIGGGGGGGGQVFAGGGGAGGFVEELNHTITALHIYTIYIGIGASGVNSGDAANGGDTSFDSITAIGGAGAPGYKGGAGLTALANGLNGGSGSGASERGPAGGASTQNSLKGYGFGFSGGNSNSAIAKSGGGGGGAGGAGNNAQSVSAEVGGLGGIGRSSTFRTGSAITYAAGGDGGSNGSPANRLTKASNSGDGGDGIGTTGGISGAGGSGILVIRYPLPTPSAPTSLVATPGDAQASISFTAGSPGTSAITNYKSSLDGTTFTALSPSVTTSPVTITGLTNGTTYNIYLKAVNTSGDGLASLSVSVTPVAAIAGDGSSSSSQTATTLIVTTTNSGTKKLISWNQSTYLVLTTYNKTTKKTRVSTLRGGRSLVAKPKPGQSATYTITSSAREVVQVFTIKSKPETPKKVEVAIHSTTLSASWKKSVGARKYRVTITPPVGKPIILITTDPNISIKLDSLGKVTFKIVAIGKNNIASKSVSKTI
jgi:hypothetical protein